MCCSIHCFTKAHTAALLEAALANTKEDSHRVGAAVLSCPPGRAIVNAAEKHAAILKVASAALKVCIGYVDAQDSPLPARLHNRDSGLGGRECSVQGV